MRAVLSVLAMLAMAFSAPASATQFLYTVTGTVVGDEFTYDEWHIFDPTQGEEFTASFVVDDAKPDSLYSYGSLGSSATGGGITQFGTRSPLTASLTIGGQTYQIRSGDYHSYPTIEPLTGDPVGPTDTIDELGSVAKDPGAHQLALTAGYSEGHSCCFPHPNDTYGQNEILDFSLNSGAFTSPDYRQAGTFALTGFGYFAKSATIVASPGALTNIYLAPVSLTVSAVPEIGSWLMIIVGVGLIGAVVRRRRPSGTGCVPAS